MTGDSDAAGRASDFAGALGDSTAGEADPSQATSRVTPGGGGDGGDGGSSDNDST
jgi:hypothetical protein